MSSSVLRRSVSCLSVLAALAAAVRCGGTTGSRADKTSDGGSSSAPVTGRSQSGGAGANTAGGSHALGGSASGGRSSGGSAGSGASGGSQTGGAQSATGATTGSGGSWSGGSHSGGQSAGGSAGSGGQSSGGASGAGGDMPGGMESLAGQSSVGGAGPGGGDAGGAAGAGLVPPGPGIPCGETTCQEGSEVCCIGESSRSCAAASSDCRAGIRAQCDDSADCPGKLCCFTGLRETPWVETFCNDTCGTLGSTQICKQPGECTNGDPCHVYTCTGPNRVGSVSLGLCAADAPVLCE